MQENLDNRNSKRQNKLRKKIHNLKNKLQCLHQMLKEQRPLINNKLTRLDKNMKKSLRKIF